MKNEKIHIEERGSSAGEKFSLAMNLFFYLPLEYEKIVRKMGYDLYRLFFSQPGAPAPEERVIVKTLSGKKVLVQHPLETYNFMHHEN